MKTYSSESFCKSIYTDVLKYGYTIEQIAPNVVSVYDSKDPKYTHRWIYNLRHLNMYVYEPDMWSDRTNVYIIMGKPTIP
jgi:hypothetical protein